MVLNKNGIGNKNASNFVSTFFPLFQSIHDENKDINFGFFNKKKLRDVKFLAFTHFYILFYSKN